MPQGRTHPYAQAVTERLSDHVLQNYDAFVEGVEEVTSVETALQVCGMCGPLAPPFVFQKGKVLYAS